MREAILLVGGQGTRLRPLTINTPKPMLPVAGVPFTVHQILRARDSGITRIVLATSYRAEVFASFIADADLGIEVVITEKLDGEKKDFGPSLKPKFTPKTNCHKVISHNDTWALTFRGPWDDIWYEYDKYGNKIELTHGRRVINER